jgi:hypothetical protein
MSTVGSKKGSRMAKVGWGMQLTISALLVLNSLGLYFFIADRGEEQTTAILLGGFGLLALALTLEGYRSHSKWAWNTAWILVGVLLLIGVHIIVVGEFSVGFFYIVLGAITLLGQFLARNERVVIQHS